MILCSEVQHETPDSDDPHIHLSLGILSILLSGRAKIDSLFRGSKLALDSVVPIE